MQKKVLVVDDSALMRRVLSDIIKSDTRFHVTKVASDGQEALSILLDGEEFDAIILDINMPKMNGLEFLKELEDRGIKETVIVVSTVAKEGAKETIYALELGAFDFVTKPENFYQVKSNEFRDKLVNCLCVATKLSTSTQPLQPLKTDVKIESKPRNIIKQTITNAPSSKRLVAIACSTGGPKALQQVITSLPENLDCSVLIVQHMPEGFTYSLAHRLNETSKIRVKEAEDGEVLLKGVVYIAKGGRQMRVVSERGVSKLAVTEEAARNALKPCADIMYESLAESDFNDIICVVLTGMGADGTSGIKTLNESKSIYVIAQDEESSTVYGMPKVITESGLVNEILPLNKIGSAVTKKLGVT